MVVQISLGHMDKDWSLVSFNTGHKCHQITHLQHKYQHKGNLFTACQDIVINMDEGTQSKRISTPIMNFYFFFIWFAIWNHSRDEGKSLLWNFYHWICTMTKKKHLSIIPILAKYVDYQKLKQFKIHKS